MLSGDIWCHLGYLKLSGAIRHYLGLFGTTWGYLTLSVGIQKYLELNMWGYLGLYLKLSGAI